MDMKCHEILEQRMCKELEILENKYSQNPNTEMSIQDVDKIDKLYHALKCMTTYSAMKESEEYENGWGSEGSSGRRGRAANGRYVSRDTGNVNRQSYADGYSEGYSEAINQMNNGSSGHYPPITPHYPRW